MAESQKPPVFEKLFRDRFDEATGSLKPLQSWIVTKGDIGGAIRVAAPGLSPENTSNFLKDFIRVNRTANAGWPQYLKDNRYTAHQVYGARGKALVFEFVPYEPGQTEPFPESFDVAGIVSSHPIEAISLPSAARALGRADEPWLIQTCVHQRVIETHFALHSSIPVVDIFHLQNSVKTTPEIDALFLVSFIESGALKKAIVSFEAKRDETILANQIKAQICRIGHDCKTRPGLADIEYVIGMACTTGRIGTERVVYMFELGPVSTTDAEAHFAARTTRTLPIVVASRAAYRFVPKVSGI